MNAIKWPLPLCVYSVLHPFTLPLSFLFGVSEGGGGGGGGSGANSDDRKRA
jgi:hypothetical protein